MSTSLPARPVCAGSMRREDRGILWQKMLHLQSGDVPQPTDDELRS